MHKHLGHPISDVFHDLLKSGILSSKESHLLVLFNLIAILVNLVQVKFNRFQLINQI